MKRSSSAPMIPEMVKEALKPSRMAGVADGGSHQTGGPGATTASLSLQRRRGLSGSNVSLPGELARAPVSGPEFSPRRQPLTSPLPLSRINSPTSRHRVEQLKKEESMDERRNEREVQERLLLSQSCNELKLDSDELQLMEVWPPPTSLSNSQTSFPYQSFVSPSSPFSKQMRSRSLTPTSPSSTRTFTYRRSCSPVLRPSSLSLLGKRPREQDPEEMDSSPTVPSKRLLLSYNSPASTTTTANHSPCISPLTGNSPLHHSFATSTFSRKSSSQSESTPLSSPSSLNPFAVNYDSGNCEHWQSGGSTGSSRGQSPSGNCSTKVDGRSISLEDVKLLPVQPMGLGSSEEHRSTLSESPEITTEAPTPLSPKGLQFRHKPFSHSTSSLPSPIPRMIQGVTVVSGLNGSTLAVSNNHTASIHRSSPVQIPKHVLQHDKHLSPFISGLEPHPLPLVPHPLPLTHTHGRHVRRKGQSQLSTSSLGTARQMSKSEPSRHLAPSHQLQCPPSSEHRYYPQVSSRLGISSPLSQLYVGPTDMDDSMASAGTCSSTVVSAAAEPRVLRLGRRRRESETSNDSREDSFMESDTSVVSSLEESLELCETDKEFESEVATTVPS